MIVVKLLINCKRVSANEYTSNCACILIIPIKNFSYKFVVKIGGVAYVGVITSRVHWATHTAGVTNTSIAKVLWVDRMALKKIR